jgi:hypothetical protein
MSFPWKLESRSFKEDLFPFPHHSFSPQSLLD